MAKTKQDYYNLGREDFLVNNPRRFTSNDSWQAQCYSNGWLAASIESASETQAQCIDVSVSVNPVSRETTTVILSNNCCNGWVIRDKNGFLLHNMIIKRKTHARNWAMRQGYQVIN